MATYKAIITEITPVGNQVRVDATMFEDDARSRPMPTVTVAAETADVAQAVTRVVALVKTELQKFKDSRALDAVLQKDYLGKDIVL